MSTTDETTTPDLADLPRLDVREGRPVVNVRDETLWAHDPRTRDAIAELGEAKVNAIYEGIVQDFWEHYAPDAARSVGYSGVIYSAGRSSGWIYPDDAPDFLKYLNADDPWSGTHDADDAGSDDGEADSYTVAAQLDRDRFLRFAAAIKGAMETCESELIDQLGAALAELRQRREDAIVRGEN